MSTSEIAQNSSGVARNQDFLNPAQVNTLSPDDPRRELFDKVKSGDIQVGGSSLQGQVLEMIRDSSPSIRFTELPVELASALLSSQHEGIMQMLKGWAESIQHNAQEDKKASLRAQEQGDLLKRQQESRSLLAPVLQRAVNTGALSESAAQELRDLAGFAAQNPEVPIAQHSHKAGEKSASAQLRPTEPDQTKAGMQIRSQDG